MSVLDQAQNVQGVVSAARKRERWQRQMANTSDEEKREQLREAIADLEYRFPEIEDIGPGGAEAFARERGHGQGSRSPTHEGRQRPGARKRASTASSQPASGRASTSTPARRDGSRRRGRRAIAPRRLAGLPSAEGAWRQTGIPAAIGSGSSLTMAVLGATVGLSLLFLMLSSAEGAGPGSKALPQLLGTVTGFIQRFISRQDILPQPGTAVASAGGVAAGPTYNERVLAGEVAGPPNLLGTLPELGRLPRVKDQGRVIPNRNLGRMANAVPRLLHNR